MRLCAHSLVDAARGVREGRITSRSWWRTACAVSQEVDGAIQAWAFLDPDHARRQARAADEHRMAGRRSGRCTAFRSASRISSTRPTIRPSSARRCGKDERRAMMRPWSPGCAPRAPSLWARPSPPNTPISIRARHRTLTIRRARQADRRAVRRLRSRPAWFLAPSARRPTARSFDLRRSAASSASSRRTA